MIEISDQAVLYFGILMFVIFLIATFIEFRNMVKHSAVELAKKRTENKKKEITIRKINVANY